MFKYYLLLIDGVLSGWHYRMLGVKINNCYLFKYLNPAAA
jgi:hypothetical protein